MDDLNRVEITRLIRDWQSADERAESQLFEVLYRRLREMAAQCLNKEIRCQSLSPTELVHEAYVRLADARHVDVGDRNHFLALAAKVMRHVVVDRARARQTVKRGGGAKQVDLLDSMQMSDRCVDEILSVDRAVSQLQTEHPRLGSVVELCYFGGFSLQDAGAVLGISERTAKREWQMARVWLKRAIDGSP